MVKVIISFFICLAVILSLLYIWACISLLSSSSVDLLSAPTMPHRALPLLVIVKILSVFTSIILFLVSIAHVSVQY